MTPVPPTPSGPSPPSAPSGSSLVGAVPMAVAATNPNADPILAEAVDGTPQCYRHRRPRRSSWSTSTASPSRWPACAARPIALTFLDPVCASDCPIIAQEFRIADELLGDDAGRVELVAVDANPRYITPDYLAAFDQQEGLDHVPNWLYLTGSLPPAAPASGSLRGRRSSAYAPAGP